MHMAFHSPLHKWTLYNTYSPTYLYPNLFLPRLFGLYPLSQTAGACVFFLWMLSTYTVQEDASVMRTFWTWGNKGRKTPKLYFRKARDKSKSTTTIFWVKVPVTLKWVMLSYWNLAASFFIKHSSGCCKILIQLQSSKEVYSDKFLPA